MVKKKILHLITGLEIGGAEMMLLKTLSQMQNEFDNRVCCIMGHGPIEEKLTAAGIATHHLNFSLKNIFGSIVDFRKIIKEFQPDILITYLIHSDLFGRIFGRIFGIKKIVCSQRGSLLQWEWLRFFDRATKFLVTKYIVQTETAKKELMKKLNLPEDKFEIISNAIDLKEYDFEINKEKKKQELKINPDNLNIVCVSNLRRGKGHKYLLEAFEKTFAENNNISLLIVGDGEKKEDLKNQIKNYISKNNIYFLGKRSDVKEILKISDIFVLPTEAEGMSNAIMEAMASRLAIITTNIPVNTELIKNEIEGILLPTKDSLSIKKALEKIINNSSARFFLGNNAKEKIKKQFIIGKVVKRLIYFYNSI